MVALNTKYIEELYEYMNSGDLGIDFQFSGEGRRLEVLEFLEKLMDLGDLADKVASDIIFRDSPLGMFAGRSPSQGDGGPGKGGSLA